METLVKSEGGLFLKKELVEGQFNPATSSDDAVEPLVDGLEFQIQRDEIEKKTLSNTIEAVEPRLGKKTVTGSIPIELKAGKVPGEEPRGGILLESLFGNKHILSEQIISEEGNTLTEINIKDADIEKFMVGMCVMVKTVGAFEVRPIKEIDSTLGAAKIVLAIPLKTMPTDNVVIEKCVTYFHGKNSPSFSGENYLGGKIKEVLTGFRALTASIDSWSLDATPSINFGVEGVNVTREVGEPTIEADFSEDALVPVINHACAWVGQEEVDYTDLSFAVETAKADIGSACSPNGKIGTRKTGFSATAGINPYMRADNVDRFTMFTKNINTSLFTYASIPSEVEGEISHVVTLWLPNVKITNMPTGDNEGILNETLEFKAFKKKGNDTVFMGFI